MFFIIFFDSLSSGISVLTLAFGPPYSFLFLREIKDLLGEGLLDWESPDSGVGLEELLRILESTESEYQKLLHDFRICFWLLVLPLCRAFRDNCAEFS